MSLALLINIVIRKNRLRVRAVDAIAGSNRLHSRLHQDLEGAGAGHCAVPSLFYACTYQRGDDETHK